jgi:hypothetical protein
VAEFDPAKRDEELLHAIEARRTQSENFAWAVPGLALTTEAFLLTIALSHDSSATARLLASIAGFAAIVASMHFMAKQVYYFDLYEAVIEAKRERLGLYSVSRDALLALRREFPQNTLMVKRGFWEWGWRRWLVKERKAVTVWTLALLAFALIDLFLFAYALTQFAGDNPRWF